MERNKNTKEVNSEKREQEDWEKNKQRSIRRNGDMTVLGGHK